MEWKKSGNRVELVCWKEGCRFIGRGWVLLGLVGVGFLTVSVLFLEGF